MCKVVQVFQYRRCGHAIRRVQGEDDFCLLRSDATKTRKAEVFCADVGGIREILLDCAGTADGDRDFTADCGGVCVRCRGEAALRAADPRATNKRLTAARRVAAEEHRVARGERGSARAC
jgi:hypothetical protein